MYLIKRESQKVVGCLLLTFENDLSWWIQSVYVVEEARRRGHFTALFQEAVRLAMQKGVRKISLYAENDNQRAKGTYRRLGMEIVPLKMYSFDFVYGKASPNPVPFYQLQRIDKDHQQYKEWLSDKRNTLTDEGYQERDWNHAFALRKNGRLCALAKLFTEFSDWRFGLAWYVREIYA